MLEVFLIICGIVIFGCLQIIFLFVAFEGVINDSDFLVVRVLKVSISLFFIVLMWTGVVYYGSTDNGNEKFTIRWEGGNGNRTECYFEYDKVLRGKIYVEEKFTVCKK